MSKKEKHMFWSRILFGLYLVVMSYFLFLSDDRYFLNSYNYNLVPFREIERFITYRHIIGLNGFAVNIIGNVVAFMPFGFLLPRLTSENIGFFKVAAYCLMFTLLIEVTQLVTMLGRFDVDDIIMNTMGGIMGYIVHVICSHCHGRKRR